jgi:hypothetical protein
MVFLSKFNYISQKISLYVKYLYIRDWLKKLFDRPNLSLVERKQVSKFFDDFKVNYRNKGHIR